MKTTIRTILRISAVTLCITAVCPLTANAGKSAERDSTLISYGHDDKKVKRTVFSLGTGFAADIAVTELLKNTIKDKRPDGKGRHSFPSRHVSWSMGVTTGISLCLYQKSPWWVFGAHIVNDAVALQRVYSRRHYPKDVIGGYVTGLSTMAGGQILGNIVFPSNAIRTNGSEPENLWAAELSSSTRALFPSGKPANRVTFGTGISSEVELRLPFGDHMGALACIDLSALPYYFHDEYIDMLKSAGISAGVAGHFPIERRWALNASARTGVSRAFDSGNWKDKKWSFTGAIDCGAEYSVTNGLKIGGFVGYGIRKFSHGVSIWSAGFSTSVIF